MFLWIDKHVGYSLEKCRCILVVKIELCSVLFNMVRQTSEYKYDTVSVECI